MTRLLGPDEASRFVYRTAGASISAASGVATVFYSDAAATLLADIGTYDGTPTPGAAIAGSSVIVDAYSKMPLFWFPDGVDTLFAVAAGGPITPVYARTDDRLDALEAGGASNAAAVAAEAAARAAADALAVPLTSVGAANGVASLGADAKVPIAQLPATVINDTFVVASQAAMLALTAQRGDVAIRSDLNRSFILSTDSPGTLADWLELLTPPDAVTSVAGRGGAVVLAEADVSGLVADLAARFTRAQSEALALSGARAGAVPGRPPLNPTPTVTVSAGAPAATPTVIDAAAGGAAADLFTSPQRTRFTFTGGEIIKARNDYPFYTGARVYPLPQLPTGYGSVTAEFLSDAPALGIYQSLGELGVLRVLIDGVEVYRCGQAVRTGTAQAGAASTITLDAGASAVNGFYFSRWIRITGGTGAGQVRQISAYVGATKVATVGQAWATAPDATSTFEVSIGRRENNAVSGNAYVLFDFAGERRLRRYRVECGGTTFYGIRVTSAVDTVCPVEPSTGPVAFWSGDSFSASTGADPPDGLAAVACAHLGWTLNNSSVGGCGYLSPIAGGTTGGSTAVDRLTPPVNAWRIRTPNSTAGSYTITQNGITATITYNWTLAQVKTAIDAAFGAGAFDVAGDGAWQLFLFGRGANAAVTAAMTFDTSGLTNPGPTHTSRYLGEIAPNVPLDADGNALPFYIVLANGHNDTTGTNAAFTPAVLQATVTTLLQNLTAAYPTARIFVVGLMYLPGGSVGADATTANAAILAACTAALPKINGAVPFIETLSPAWFTGTGRIGALANNGNSDAATDTDGVHPSPHGHRVYGRRIAERIAFLLQRIAA